MNYDENSILPYLGFIKSSYFNKFKYEAENSINIGDNIFYLVIENISDEPLFLIDMDTNNIIKLVDLNSHILDTIEIDHLIIKFYKTKNFIIKNNKEYSFFFENDHKIELEFN